MKLSELFEDIKRTPSKRDWYGAVQSIADTQSRTGIKQISGTGPVYSRVYDLPKKTNTVLKVARHPEGKKSMDGYFSFVRSIMKMDNPYFPKVDEIDEKEVGADGMPYFTVEMEKLHPITGLTDREVQSVFSKMFERPVEDAEMQQLFDKYVKQPQMRIHAERMSMLLAEFIETAIMKHKEFDLIKDPQLIQAIKVLRVFWANYHYLDIHNANIMCRRTPYGIQLVFTDPFSIIRKPVSSMHDDIFKPE